MKARILAVLVPFMTIGCATKEQQSALEWVAGGAGSSYLLCKQFGGDDKKCRNIAILTGVAGGAIGYTWTKSIEKLDKELAGKEDKLDKRLDYLRGLNERAEKLNQELQQKVTQLTRRTDQVVAKIKHKRISEQELAKERENLDNEVNTAKAQIALLQERLQHAKQLQAQYASHSTEEDAEIGRLERKLKQLRPKEQALAKLRQKM